MTIFRSDRRGGPAGHRQGMMWNPKKGTYESIWSGAMRGGDKKKGASPKPGKKPGASPKPKKNIGGGPRPGKKRKK